MSKSSGYVRVVALLQDYFAAYDHFTTMLVLAYIRSCQDVTDEALANEYDYCESLVPEVRQLTQDLLTACANSHLSQRLERYFGEGFAQQYVEDDENEKKDVLLALAQKEAGLLAQYRSIIAGSTVSFQGVERSYSQLVADDQLTDQEYAQVRRAYYEKYTPILGELYIQLVQVRQELAAAMGYDGYEDYAFTALYERDYTPQQARDLLKDIQQEIGPISARLTEESAWLAAESWPMTEQQLTNCLAAAAQAMGSQEEETFQLLDTYHLYDITVSANKAELSYQQYLPDYQVPFAFIYTQGTSDDLLTFAHEFGHCVDSWYNYDATYSLELAETFSLAMEAIAPQYCTAVLTQEEIQQLNYVVVLNSVDTFAQQGSLAYFEQQVYATPAQELTVEDLCALSLSCAQDFGYAVAGQEDYYADSWVDIPHLFIEPFYVVSYCVANVPAMEIYYRECQQQGSGLSTFNDLLPRERDGFLETISTQSDLSNPFAPETMAEMAKIITQQLALTVETMYIL